MKLLSIDVETTSISPVDGILLSVGIVLWNSENNEYLKKEILLNHNNVIYGYKVAIAMNRELIERIKISDSIQSSELKHEIKKTFDEFGIKSKSDFILCGKNFSSFDRFWIESYNGFDLVSDLIPHRCVDPASMFLTRYDTEAPSMAGCKMRANELYGPIFYEEYKHDAITDCIEVIDLIKLKLF